MNSVTLLCGRLYKNLIALPILLSGGECKQAGSSSHSCLFAFIDFFSFSLLFFFSNGRHCASCQNVVIENNTSCERVFVCVESVLVPENNVCMYVCANQDEHCGLSQPVIYMLLSNELTVQKKKIII